MSSRQLQVVLDLDTSSYSGRLNAAGAQMRTFGGQVKSASTEVDTFGHALENSGHMASSSLTHLRDYVLTIAGIESIVESVGHKLVGVMEEAISMSAELERQTLLMKGMSTAVGDAAKMQEARRDMAQLFELSKNTGYSVQDLANGFVRLKSTGIDPMKGMLQETTDAVAAFGGNSNTMQHVALALQEMADKGTLSLKELRRQFAIFVPDGMRTMAQVLGMTMDEMTKKISKGAIQARPAMELMMRQLGIAHAGAAKQMADTLIGLKNQFDTNMIQMSQAFTGEASQDANSLYNTIKSVMKEINTALQSNEGKAAFYALGRDIAGIVHDLASLARIMVEYRGLIMGIAEAVGLALAMKLFRAWATDGLSLIANLRSSVTSFLETEARTQAATASRLEYNAALVAGVRANQDELNIIQERMNLEAEAAAQEEGYARQQLEDANKQLRAAEQQVEALRVQQEARLRLVQTMEVEEQAALQQLQTGRLVTGQFISREQALTEYQAATSRLTTAETMLARTDAELAAAEAKVATATDARAQAQGIAVTATENLNAATVRQEAATTAATAELTLYERAAAAGTVVMDGLGAAVDFVLGPWGIFIGLVTQGAYELGLFESAADKAASAADRMRQGFEKAGDAAEVASRKANIAQQIQNIQSHRNADGSVSGGEFANGAWGSPILSKQDADNEVQQLNKQLDDLNNAQKASYKHHFDQDVQNIIDTKTQATENFKRAMYAADQKQWQAINGDLSKDPNNKNAAALASRLSDAEDARVRRFNQQQLSDLQKTADGYRKNQNGAQIYTLALGALAQQFDSTSSAALRNAALSGDASKAHDKAAKSIMGHKVALAGLEAKLNGAGVAMAKFNEKLKDGGFKGYSASDIATERGIAEATDAVTAAMKRAGEEKQFNNKIESAAGKLAELKSKLADGGLNKELDKFNAELAANPEAFKNIPLDKIAELRRILGEIDKTNHDIAVKGLFDKLDKKADEAAKRLQGVWASYNAGTLDADKRTDSLRANLMAMADTLGLDATQMANFKKIVDQTVADTQTAAALIEANKLRNDTDKINMKLAAGGDSWAAKKAQLQEEINLEWEKVRATKQGTAERKKAEEDFYNWKKAKDAEFARDNENEVTKQARQWYDLSTNLQQAYASIISSFVDGLSSGSLDFKKFAGEILKDIAKVIIEAAIAYAILSAIGQTKGQSFGSFMRSNIADSLHFAPQNPETTVPAATHHTGGIIGQASSFKLVDPSVFVDAAKYHGGGIITPLGPKEVPMIGLEGERVLTEDEQKAIASRQNNPPPVTVNVVNNGSEQLHPDVGTHWDGKQMIVSVILEAASKQGPLRDALQAMGKK